jgi:hypothetical protein
MSSRSRCESPLQIDLDFSLNILRKK